MMIIVFLILQLIKFVDSLILDFRWFFFFICAYIRSVLTTLKCDVGTILIGTDSNSKTMGICTMKVKVSDGNVRILTNIKHVPKPRRGLISLRAQEILGYELCANDGINQGALVTNKEAEIEGILNQELQTILL